MQLSDPFLEDFVMRSSCHVGSHNVVHECFYTHSRTIASNDCSIASRSVYATAGRLYFILLSSQWNHNYIVNVIINIFIQRLFTKELFFDEFKHILCWWQHILCLEFFCTNAIIWTEPTAIRHWEYISVTTRRFNKQATAIDIQTDGRTNSSL